MKNLVFIFTMIASPVFAQLTIDDAKKAGESFGLGSYSYHEKFIGHPNYGAPVILTSDGGAALFGDSKAVEGVGAKLIKLNASGEEEWSQVIMPLHDGLESQSVIQDATGNYFVFILSYYYDKYRGGAERVVYIDSKGKIKWDKMLGAYASENSPHCSYVHLNDDGKLEMRGHITLKAENEQGDGASHYWTGFLDSKGELVSEVGEIIDWADQDRWQGFFSPE